MSNFEPEPERDYGPFLGMANEPPEPLLVNIEPVEGFDIDQISQDVEGLLWLGKLTKNVTIFGHSFVIRTLTRGDRLSVSLFVQDYENSLGLADAMQTAYLALAIEEVDGRPLSIPLGPEKPQDKLARNFDIVSKWYDPTIELLYIEYRDLTNRMIAAFRELEGK